MADCAMQKTVEGALTACTRKLLTVLDAMVRDGRGCHATPP